MRNLCIMLIVMAAATTAQTQKSVTHELPPDVQIVNHSFFEQIVRSYYSAPLPDPLTPTLVLWGGPQIKQSGWGPVSKQFRYQMKIKNAGAREIRVVDWAYVFNDPTSQMEVGRHYFRSQERIRRNEERTVFGVSESFPTQVVSADTLASPGHQEYAERVEINCIAYSDGSVWKRESFRGRCRPLKRRSS